MADSLASKAELKTACVTGAASGIGQAVVRRLVQDGVQRFVLVDIDAPGLQHMVHEIEQVGLQAHTVCVDIADHEAVSARLTSLATQIGHIDIVTHCAGMSGNNALDDASTWFRIINVNLHGSFSISRALVPFMREGGRIVHVASILGVVGRAQNTAYVAAKHGVVGFCKALALDLAAQGITVNVVMPAWVDTPMLRRELEMTAHTIGRKPAEMLAKVRKQIPIKRLVQVDEVAHTIAFLCSPMAAAITAQRIMIDGGLLCGA